MRLHLLQAVLNFHQNNRFEAERLLLVAEQELKALQISEDSILILSEMGK